MRRALAVGLFTSFCGAAAVVAVGVVGVIAVLGAEVLVFLVAIGSFYIRHWLAMRRLQRREDELDRHLLERMNRMRELIEERNAALIRNGDRG